MKRILVSWIGHTDLKAMAASAPASRSKAVRTIVGDTIDSKVGAGPLKTLLDQESFGQIHLLADYRSAASKEFAAGVGGDPKLHDVTLKLPPLRERSKDIEKIAKAMLVDINQRLKKQGGAAYRDKSLSVDTIRFMQRYPWPGNVRELSNALVQAAMMADSAVLKPQDIAAAVAEFPSAKTNDLLSLPLGGDFVLDSHLLDIQRHFLHRVMTESDGKVTKAAKLLGYKNYQTLSAQLERLGVEFENEAEPK